MQTPAGDFRTLDSDLLASILQSTVPEIAVDINGNLNSENVYSEPNKQPEFGNDISCDLTLAECLDVNEDLQSLDLSMYYSADPNGVGTCQ